MNYSEEDIEKIHAAAGSVVRKKDELNLKFLTHECKNGRTKEYMVHGFGRRISTMARCISNIFTLLPPENNSVPEDGHRKDAEINLQAFVLNTSGCLDNLAHICVFEKEIRKPNGDVWPSSYIGFGKGNKQVRKEFSAGLISILDQHEDWLKLQADYRHALTHRIPLYIAPFAVPEAASQRYEELEKEIAGKQKEMFANIMNGAMFWRLSEENDKLREEQLALAHFRPTMMHSFAERAPEIVFHAQILADFTTIVELGEHVLTEISK